MHYPIIHCELARNIGRGLLGRYYNPIRRRMVESRQARSSQRSTR